MWSCGVAGVLVYNRSCNTLTCVLTANVPRLPCTVGPPDSCARGVTRSVRKGAGDMQIPVSYLYVCMTAHQPSFTKHMQRRSYEEFREGPSRALNPAWSPLELGALWTSLGHTPVKMALASMSLACGFRDLTVR